jgi:hypothetical protein
MKNFVLNEKYNVCGAMAQSAWLGGGRKLVERFGSGQLLILIQSHGKIGFL